MILQGDFTALNTDAVRKVKTVMDNNQVPGFLVVYRNGDTEVFSIREFDSEDNTVDVKLTIAINNYFFPVS